MPYYKKKAWKPKPKKYRKKYMPYKRNVNVYKRVVKAEVFHKTNSVSGAIDNDNPTIQHLNNIAQGDDDGTRSGNSIFMKKLTYNYTIELVSETDLPSSNRVVVLMDTQQVADTTPGWPDVFTSTNHNSLLNVGTLGRFKILYDRYHNVHVNAPFINVKGVIYINKSARFNGSATSDIQKNGLYVMLNSNTGDAARVAVIASQWRLFYSDS